MFLKEFQSIEKKKMLTCKYVVFQVWKECDL